MNTNGISFPTRTLQFCVPIGCWREGRLRAVGEICNQQSPKPTTRRSTSGESKSGIPPPWRKSFRQLSRRGKGRPQSIEPSRSSQRRARAQPRRVYREEIRGLWSEPTRAEGAELKSSRYWMIAPSVEESDQSVDDDAKNSGAEKFSGKFSGAEKFSGKNSGTEVKIFRAKIFRAKFRAPKIFQA